MDHTFFEEGKEVNSTLEALKVLPCESRYLCLLVTVGTYLIGRALQRRYNSAFVNPILISIGCSILGLIVFRIDNKTYQQATSGLSLLMTPATICLAVPLYRQFELVKANWRAILGACLAGVLCNFLLVWLISRAFSLEYEQYVTLLSKSITIPIGADVTQELGGIVPITCGTISFTGIMGNILGSSIMSRLGIVTPLAQGLGIGVSSHAMGTARALELGETQGAFSGLAIGLTGVCTVLLAPFAASLPL